MYFIRFAERQRKSIERVPYSVMRAFETYNWPRNIRALQNFIERSVMLTKGVELRAPLAELTNQEMPDDIVCTLAMQVGRTSLRSSAKPTGWWARGTVLLPDSD